MKNDRIASIELNKNKLSVTDDKPWNNRIKLVIDAILYASIAYLFSFVWFDQVISSLSLNYKATYYWLTKLIISLVLLLIVNFPKIFGLGFLGAGTLALVIGLAFQGSFGAPIYSFIARHTIGIINSVKWITGFGSEINTIPQYFIIYIAYLSILLAMLLIYVKPMPLILIVVWIAPYIVAFQLNIQEFSLFRFFLGLVCIAITFARQSSYQFSWRKVWQIPPVALLALLLGIIFTLQTILPQDIFYNAKINRFLEQMIKSNQKMSDTVHYYEFSIRDVGFYPQDQQLGGPIEQENKPFMTFYGPARPLYLRGTVFNSFDKNIWHASAMNTNYLFYNDDPINQQAEAFKYPELSMLKPASWNNYFTEEKITISPIYQPIQTVFHGGKPKLIINNDDELATRDSLAISENDSKEGTLSENDEETRYYFNPDGQIYASEEIPTRGYTVVGQASTIGSSANYMNFIQNDLNVANMAFSEQTLTNNKSYRAYLESMEPELAKIVYQNADEEAAKGAKLNAIVDYLKTRFTYNLEVEKVPSSQDFFEHFISSKEGYCTYFATALTVLAREAGFEARYVEGFIAPGVKDRSLPQEDYQRLISSDQAHAWTEVKFDQLGWLALDATPANDLYNIQVDQAKEDELQANLPEAEETQPTVPEPTPPVPTEPPQTKTIESEFTEKAPGSFKISKTLLILLSSLLVAVLIFIYLIRKRRIFLRRHQLQWLYDYFDHDLKLIVIYIWQDLKYLYKLNDRELDPDQTILQAFSTMLNTFNWDQENSFSAYRVIDQILYAEKEPDLNDLESLFTIYQQAEDTSKANLSKLKWFWHRFLFSPKPIL